MKAKQRKVVLIKLGGSVVTFKDKPLTANVNAINGICKSIAKLDSPIIIVHGGGSFGHYWSVKYNMHTKADEYDPKGISLVHQSMIELNQIIVNAMIKHSIDAYGIMPSSFTTGLEAVNERVKKLSEISNNTIVPVTYGDVVHVRAKKYSILSGDAIMTLLARELNPEKVIFALNVDGIFNNMKSKQVIKEIDYYQAKDRPIRFSKVNADVTGGMQRKVTEAFKMAALGVDVMMVNGLHPERLLNAISGKMLLGTLIKGRRGRIN
jgi:isopentenyl phosphate kinase